MTTTWRRALGICMTLVLAGSVLVGFGQPASALGPNAIVNDPGCAANSVGVAGNSQLAGLPFPLTFFGTTYSAVYVNSDGSVTFTAPGIHMPAGALPTNVPIIAPFYAKTDPNGGGTVTYGNTTFGGRPAFCANWLDVASAAIGGARNDFQLLLVERSDIAAGDFDVIFNYDRVEWDVSFSDELFCVDPMDPQNCGFAPEAASIGYSAPSLGARFQMPNSGQGGFVDGATSGLVHSSTGSLQLGRYRFPLDSNANGQGVIQGDVRDATSGAPLPGAYVDLCQPNACIPSMTNSAGQYAFLGLVAGTYTLRAFPPANDLHLPTSVAVSNLAVSETRVVNLALQYGAAVPPGTTVSPAFLGPNGVPRIFWGNPVSLTTLGCAGGTATWEARQNGVLVAGHSGPMTEGPSGTYKATIPPFSPTSGVVHIEMVVTCPDGSTSVGDFDFNIYIDPSGVVMDTTGTLLPGASVTLYRSDQPGGPFTQVPNGSAIMSPSNRTNPDSTDSVGHFGWDVIAGYYTVRAAKPGCHNPAAPTQLFVETAVMTIPPPVTDLELVLQCPSAGSDFNPLTPARLVDTRLGVGAPAAKIGPAGTLNVAVTSVGGVPASGVGAVVLNVTVTEPTADSWLTVFPAGQNLPLASNLNFVANQTVPNLVIAKVGANGQVSVYNSAGSTHLVIDVVGWFAAGAPSYTSLTPARIVDTRLGVGAPTAKIGPAATLDVAVTGIGGVPASGVAAVVVNVTVTEPTAGGWLTVFPAGQPLPLASNLNFVANQTVPNLVIAKVGANGKVSVYNSTGSTHLVVDVVGWFAAGTPSYTSLTPARIVDTRLGVGAPTAKIGPAATLDVAVTGIGGVPASGVTAVVVNVAVTEPTGGGWLTVFPAGQPLPLASNLNFVPNQTVPNLVIAKVGADGKVSVYNSAGSTHVVIDVMGWFTA